MMFGFGIISRFACPRKDFVTVKTQITFEQVLPTPNPGLFAVVLVNGQPQVRVVSLAEGLSFDATTGALTVTFPPAEPAPPAQAKYDVQPVRQTDGSWLLPDTPTGALQVSLNGLHMTKDLDYTVDGASITFAVEQTAAVAGAIVSASYQY